MEINKMYEIVILVYNNYTRTLVLQILGLNVESSIFNVLNNMLFFLYHFNDIFSMITFTGPVFCSSQFVQKVGILTVLPMQSNILGNFKNNNIFKKN